MFKLSYKLNSAYYFVIKQYVFTTFIWIFIMTPKWLHLLMSGAPLYSPRPQSDHLVALHMGYTRMRSSTDICSMS